MSQQAVPELLRGWLTARSVARKLPLPILDHGGFYVNTNSETEFGRWVFPSMCEGLRELGKELKQPRWLLKLCGSGEELRDALPQNWHAARTGYLMELTTFPKESRQLPPSYQLECVQDRDAVRVQINAPDGELAASGYGAAVADVFAYDRIQTSPAHRRKGLGWQVVMTLRAYCPRGIRNHLLVATEDGYKLYMAMGAAVLSPYSTAEVCSSGSQCAGQIR